VEKDFRNSPLEKGDKGGCKAYNEEESKKQPPPPPLLRGNLSTTSLRFPCPAGLMGNVQLGKEGYFRVNDILRTILI